MSNAPTLGSPCTPEPRAARGRLGPAFRWAGLLPVAAALLASPVDAGEMSDTRILPENSFFGKNTDGRPYLYGQINKGFLVHSDGGDTKFYPFVDNGNSPTRAGVAYEEKWWPNVTVFANVEAQWTPYSSNIVNQFNGSNVNLDAAFLRKAEISFDIDEAGRFWIGQGSMASDGSAEMDLSGTGVVAYSGVGDSAGAQFYAFHGAPGLSGVQIFRTFANLDGLGRSMRVRYDTPSFFGLTLGGSAGYNALLGGNQGESDVAAKYGRNNKEEDFAISAAAAYAWPADADTRLSGSFSVLHKPTGLSLTLAAARDTRKASSRTPTYFYGKLGYAPTLTTLGPTAFSIDVYLGEDFNVLGSESFSLGLAGVQTIDFKDGKIDLYGLVRLYSYDDSTANYDDGLSVLTGVRWQF